MNKQEFIDQYCASSEIEEEELLETQVVLPCECLQNPEKDNNQTMPFDGTWIDYFGDNY